METRADLRSSIRALFGAWAGDRPVPLPDISPDFPPAVLTVVTDAVPMLADYQGVAYARLYLHRLRRFTGRRDVEETLFARIATLMAERMAYQDPVRIAQMLLMTPRETAPRRQCCAFRLDELIEPLPDLFADPLLAAVGKLGWSRRAVTLQYYPCSAGGRARLHFESGLRHWRALGRNARRERAWVERWLHMIDRAFAKRPDAVAVIVETATMIASYGEVYRQGLADWHLIIEGLVKPVFDGRLMLNDLGGAVVEARAAAGPDPQQARLKTAIAKIVARATQHEP